MDSGYKANSIANHNHMYHVWEVNRLLSSCYREQNDPSAGQDEILRWAPRVAEWELCGGRSEVRRSDFGTARSDKQESQRREIPKPACSVHARSKCAANPCCRTIRNAHTRYIQQGRPRRKTASHTHGNAKGATLPFPQGNP